MAENVHNKELTSTINKYRKEMSENGTIDELKAEFLQNIYSMQCYTDFVTKLEKAYATPEVKSYEDIFRELGGSPAGEQKEELEDVLKTLVETEAGKFSPEEKTHIFTAFQNILKSKTSTT